jgi:Xaa-Pro aminopeptidase
MRHAPIANSLFIENRKRLIEFLKPRSVAIVNANDISPTTTDGSAAYYPQDDLFWLTGIEQEESVLLLSPDAFNERHRCVLFIREPSPHLKIWEGEKLSKEQAQAISGITDVRWLSELPTHIRVAMCESEWVYLNSNEHPRSVIETDSRDARFISALQRQYPLHQYQRLAPHLGELRMVKSPAEIALIKQACSITREGFLDVLSMLQPGVNECEVEAVYAHAFISRRGRMAYNPIVAGGPNSCVLHYNANDRVCQEGELLLLDVASSYANYNSDLTRTIPVNGRFTKRQRSVYDAVLRTVHLMTKLAIPGKLLRDWQKECEAAVTQELLTLGLISAEEVKKQTEQNPACKKYFMHGCGHHIGLGVHDLGPARLPLAKGSVITIEPGIYIPEEGFGIRIENDIAINDQLGAINLMADIPIEAEEIEQLMAKKNSRPIPLRS